MGCVQGKSVLTDEDIDFIARNTAMKREAVEIQYKTFLQKHPDGRISRKSFHVMMKECYPGDDDDGNGDDEDDNYDEDGCKIIVL